MKYTKEERMEIGRRIYNGEISRYEAAEEYGILYTLVQGSKNCSSLLTIRFEVISYDAQPGIMN